jgi:hypothetical protein
VRTTTTIKELDSLRYGSSIGLCGSHSSSLKGGDEKLKVFLGQAINRRSEFNPRSFDDHTAVTYISRETPSIG